MGFCPELARPLGAPTLILREAGRRGRVSRVTTLRFSAADNGERRRSQRVSSVEEMLHPLVGLNCQLTDTAQLRTLNLKNPDVNIRIM